ncbi:MAG: alpha/beta fold hydrolase, partial [Myxococcales bacterium]|nr:alpha/beta fold hydrolase [Myxococcales bacterium]
LPFGVTRRRRRMTRDVMRAYRAPFPTRKSRESILAFPRHIPLGPGDAAYARMARTDEGLARLTQPVLILWGDRDPVFPARVARKFRERLPNVKGEIHFPDASHFLQEDKPSEIAAAIIKFVKDTP